LEMEMPLPPSTIGSTSIPPMRIALIGFMAHASPGRLTQPYVVRRWLQTLCHGRPCADHPRR
jgi:hypothetical protein